MDFPSLSLQEPKRQEPKRPNSPKASTPAFVDALQREKALDDDANSVPRGHVRLTQAGAEYGTQISSLSAISDHQFIQRHMAALCDHWARWRDNYIDLNGLDTYNHFYMPPNYTSYKIEDDLSDGEAFSDDDYIYDD
jgi:hypothetical protein